jgi:hypothetical protein
MCSIWFFLPQVIYPTVPPLESESLGRLSALDGPRDLVSNHCLKPHRQGEVFAKLCGPKAVGTTAIPTPSISIEARVGLRVIYSPVHVSPVLFDVGRAHLLSSSP